MVPGKSRAWEIADKGMGLGIRTLMVLVSVLGVCSGWITRVTAEEQNHYGGIVVVDGMLYGTNNPGLLACVNSRTGEVKWSDRRPGKCSILLC